MGAPHGGIANSKMAVAADPATGATYYYNESTRETSWTPPEVEKEEQGEWRARRDETSGCDYCATVATGETPWTRPEERRLDEPEEEPRKLAPAVAARVAPEVVAGAHVPQNGTACLPEVAAHVPPPPIMKEPPARRSSTELDYRGPAPPTRTEPPARRPHSRCRRPHYRPPPSKRPTPPHYRSQEHH